MTKVEKNMTAEKMAKFNPKFVAVWNGNDGAYITAFGDYKEKVNDEGHFHWAMVCDYEGTYKVLPREEVEVLN